jgi:dihydroflavonol-4-reductase
VTILVTGATGFVGSAVVRALLARGEAVRILVRQPHDPGQVAGLPVEVAVGDLQDPASLAPAVAGCTALFHIAADYRLLARDPASLYRTNVEGTRALLRAAGAAGVRKIVHTSSVATLGLHADGSPADETTTASLADMVGHYKRSKHLAEQAVRELVERDGLPAVIVNPSTPVGPRDARPTPTGRMVLTAARGHMPAYVDTGLNIVHVDDVALGHVLALERGRIGERYILGGQNYPLAEILATIARLVGRRPPRLRLPTAPLLPIAILADALARWRGAGEPLLTAEGVRMAKKRMYFSSAKAERELGYRARPAEAALADALEWYRAEGRLR